MPVKLLCQQEFPKQNFVGVDGGGVSMPNNFLWAPMLNLPLGQETHIFTGLTVLSKAGFAREKWQCDLPQSTRKVVAQKGAL